MTKKLTFSEMQAEVQTSKNNSDLMNLAHALEAIKAERQALDRAETTIVNLAARIEQGEVVDVSEVKAAFDAGRRLGRAL